MLRPSIPAALSAVLALAACSPSFNWREVRPENTPLSLLLPCKPDKAKKTVPLGSKPVELGMTGCDAGGATFAVASADLGDAAAVAGVLAQWQALTLVNMKAPPLSAGASTGAQGTQALPLKVPGANAQPAPVLVTARGQRANGKAVNGQAAYFAQGSRVYQVVLYSERLAPEVSETFFSSLKLD